MSETKLPVTEPGVSTPAMGISVPFRFAGAVLQPGESPEALQRKNNQTDFRKQALLSVGIAVVFALFVVLSGLGPALSNLGFKVSETLQFLCSAYLAWCIYWGFREIVYLSESDKEPGEGIALLVSLLKTVTDFSTAIHVLVAGLFIVPLVCGGAVLLFGRRLYRSFCGAPVDETNPG